MRKKELCCAVGGFSIDMIDIVWFMRSYGIVGGVGRSVCVCDFNESCV